MRAPQSPLQCYFSFLVQYQVPSASTWWIMATFILHVFNFQTSAFTLSLGQPSNALGRYPLQTSTKPLLWSPSCSLCCIAYSEHACGPKICLLLLWLERLWSSNFFFAPLDFCSQPVVFCVCYSPGKLVKRWYSWGVYTAHTDQWGLWTCQGHLGATVMQILVIIKVQ